MTTRAESRGDFQVEMIAAEQQKTFQYSAIKAWNSLSANIKDVGTMTQFKKTLKLFLINNIDYPFPLIT